MNPAARQAGELIRSRAIGRILGTTVYSTTAGFGRTIPAAARYLEDPAVGMNLTTIQTAHTIDFALRLTGPLSSLSALTTVQYPGLTVADMGTCSSHGPRPRPRTGPLRGWEHPPRAGSRRPTPPGTPVRMDIVGTDGTLTLIGGAPADFRPGRRASPQRRGGLDEAQSPRAVRVGDQRFTPSMPRCATTSPTEPAPHRTTPTPYTCRTSSTTS